MPKPPKKDVITYVLNANKFLRYGATLDNTHPEDQIREFIIYISLADGKIKIMEPPIRNSGIKGGMFLSARLVMRPGCDRNMPEYYEPKDFWIGKIVTIYSHRFRIVSADLYVYRYMQEHPEMFEPEAVDGVRNYLLLNGKLREDLKVYNDFTIDYKTDKNASKCSALRRTTVLRLNKIRLHLMQDQLPAIWIYVCRKSQSATKKRYIRTLKMITLRIMLANQEISILASVAIILMMNGKTESNTMTKS